MEWGKWVRISGKILYLQTGKEEMRGFAKIWVIVAVASVAVSAAIASDYAMLSRRASRFVEDQEWNSAQAMYELMLDARPDDVGNYGTAIVIAGIRNDTVTQMSLLRQSLSNYIAIDSLFGKVRQESFDLCHAQEYEEFLYRAAHAQPWMRRTVDAYLMRYYTFRRDPDMMVRYSEQMLKGLPDDVGFLTTLAEGELQSGDYMASMSTYRKILSLDGNNYNALLNIGNYGALMWGELTTQERERTLAALRKASSLRRTPYVDQLLRQLTEKQK